MKRGVDVKKSKMNVVAMLILMLSTYIVVFFNLNSDKALAATLQDNLEITDYYAEKRPGGGTSLETGQQLRVHMEFKIDPLPEGTSVGDTFEITIPNDYNFSYHWSTGVLGNTPSDPYLTYEIQGDKIVLLFAKPRLKRNVCITEYWI